MLSILSFAQSIALAGPASLVLVDTPLPPGAALPQPSAEFQELPQGPVAVCGVSWTVPTAGTPSAEVDAGCPAEHRAAVASAAALWSFGAVEPAKGQSTITVRRWLVLEPSGQQLVWRISADPHDAPKPPEGCIRATRKPFPRFPSSFEGQREECSVWFEVDGAGRPTQIEVGGCPNSASLSVVDAMEDWHFQLCKELPADQRHQKIDVKFRTQ